MFVKWKRNLKLFVNYYFNMSGALHLNIFLVLVFVIVGNDGFCSDSLTYFIDIKPIIDEHCTGCHRKGQTAPFSLESYEDVKKRASMIEMVVESKYMPPWHADTLFRTFHNQRALSEESLNKILTWIKDGAAEGLPQKKGAVNILKWPFKNHLSFRGITRNSIDFLLFLWIILRPYFCGVLALYPKIKRWLTTAGL